MYIASNNSDCPKWVMVSGKHTRALPGARVTVQNGQWSPVSTVGCFLAMSRECYDVKHFSCGTKSAKVDMQTAAVGYRCWGP